MSLAAGTRLGPYEILAPLGAGGMGEVWRARDSRLGRDVALKVLPAALATDPERLARFEREAKTVAALNHPNIVTVHSVDEIGGVRFLTMEVVEGTTLAANIPERGLSVERLLELAIPLTDALASAHARGVIHRDLKPGNVMVTGEGRVKVLDFGLAKLMVPRPPEADPELTLSAGLTRAGQIFGTAAYMSPEQAVGRAVDPRSDIFSLGTVLYEMATGLRAFTGESQAAVISAILRDTPSAVSDVNRTLPVGLSRIIQRCLQKEPEKRYASAAEVRAALQEIQASLLVGRATGISRNAWLGVAAAAVVAAAIAGWLWHRASRARWVLETATPEIARLVEAEEYAKAAALAQEARAVLPQATALEDLWMEATEEISIETVPSGADVSARPYLGDPGEWKDLGRTPLLKIRVPLIGDLYRYAKPGFVTRYEIGFPSVPIPLDLEGSVPADMVHLHVVGGTIAASIIGLDQLPGVPAEDYLIDLTEVTNEEYAKFVEAGGYQRRELWKQPFVKDGLTVPWAAAVALFRDSTGRPGPATWDVGSFPKGLESQPVAGVSWYEAAAYAEFAGKSLPTVYHWGWAARVAWAYLIVPGSNFQGTGTVPVGGEGTLGRYGTYDMAGNVKEWCWNEGAAGKRFILGGGFGEQPYMFQEPDVQSPWDRRPNYGFRCAKLPSPPSPAAAARVEPVFRDFSQEKPVSDEVFNAFKGLYSYDKRDLDARVEERVTTESGTREKVSFNAAYGGERVFAYLFLPKRDDPPYQTVVYFPGSWAEYDAKFNLSSYEDFVIKSGRALMYPVFKGTYERREVLKSDVAEPTADYRDHMIAWSKDLGRVIDYLETRRDVDSVNLAYYGYSWGSEVAPVMLAVESRFKVAILAAGGLPSGRALPEADPINFVSRVKLPVLMLNGRYDDSFPLESSQLPLFRRLGTTEKDRRHVIFDSGHIPPLKDLIRETLDWLDRYLGPVNR